MDHTGERLLAAAERLIVRFGFAKVTMEEIAREAGLARATIYLHFRSKTDVGIACADRIHERLLDHLQSLAELNVPPSERLRQMLIGRVLFAAESARNVSVAFEDMFAAIKPQYMVRRETYFDNEAKIFLKVLREGHKSGELHVSGKRQTALALVLSTNALMPFSLNARQLAARAELESRAAKIAELVVGGLRAEPQSGSSSRKK